MTTVSPKSHCSTLRLAAEKLWLSSRGKGDGSHLPEVSIFFRLQNQQSHQVRHSCILWRSWEHAHDFVDSFYSLVSSHLEITSFPEFKYLVLFLCFLPGMTQYGLLTTCHGSVSLCHMGSSCGESWLSAPSLYKVPRPGYQSRSCVWKGLPQTFCCRSFSSPDLP